MKYRITFILFIAFFFSGCLKDKLKGEKEILIGTWNWTETINTNGYCSGSITYSDTITPSNSTDRYRVEFKKKGRVLLYKNNVEIDKGRIKFNSWKQNSTNHYTFDIIVDGKSEKNLLGEVTLSTITLYNYYFPFDIISDCNGCCKYTSHFSKQ